MIFVYIILKEDNLFNFNPYHFVVAVACLRVLRTGRYDVISPLRGKQGCPFCLSTLRKNAASVRPFNCRGHSCANALAGRRLNEILKFESGIIYNYMNLCN
jgi:hypothetical protein